MVSDQRCSAGKLFLYNKRIISELNDHIEKKISLNLLKTEEDITLILDINYSPVCPILSSIEKSYVSSSYTDITHGSRSDITDPLSILLEARFEPCQVCGEQSSGLHCGAITCEACKVRIHMHILISSVDLEIFFTIN